MDQSLPMTSTQTTTNDNSSTDAVVDGKTPQPSPNEVKFDEAVKPLLGENCPHRDLKLRLSQLVLEEGRKLPPIKVVYCASYGGFGFSAEFEAFLASHFTETDWNDLSRSDPTLVQAISDYGRLICDKFPFILDDMRTVYTWKLVKLLGNLLSKKRFPTVEKSTDVEFDAALVAEATSFVDQMSHDKGSWRKDSLGSFPNGSRMFYEDHPEIDLRSFAELHPDFWMAQYCIGSKSIDGPVTFQIALRFAHVLLQGSDRARYSVVEPDEAQDAAIYERIGLCGASISGSQLAIEEVPALVDFLIDEYDGLETVTYKC